MTVGQSWEPGRAQKIAPRTWVYKLEGWAVERLPGSAFLVRVPVLLCQGKRFRVKLPNPKGKKKYECKIRGGAVVRAWEDMRLKWSESRQVSLRIRV